MPECENCRLCDEPLPEGSWPDQTLCDPCFFRELGLAQPERVAGTSAPVGEYCHAVRLNLAHNSEVSV